MPPSAKHRLIAVLRGPAWRYTGGVECSALFGESIVFFEVVMVEIPFLLLRVCSSSMQSDRQSAST